MTNRRAMELLMIERSCVRRGSGMMLDVDLGYVKVEAVEAGYNRNHNVKNCVGLILTFSDGATVYLSGDTSTTPQMKELAARNLD